MTELHLTEEMYQENILDHYKKPRNKKELLHHTHYCKQNNPLCGDEVHLFLRIAEECIAEASFTGRGCAISQASASLLTESIKSKSVAEVSVIDEQKVLSLLGIPVSPLRQNCAFLSLRALQRALHPQRGKAE